MPYIRTSMRAEARQTPVNAGELNYAITALIDNFLCDRGGLSYHSLNEAMGALECAKLELYRRIAAPYEDVKMRENGDAYSEEIVHG